MITGLINDLLALNETCKAAVIDKSKAGYIWTRNKLTSLWQGKSTTWPECMILGVAVRSCLIFSLQQKELRSFYLFISPPPMNLSVSSLLNQAPLTPQLRPSIGSTKRQDHFFIRRLKRTSGYQLRLLALLAESFWNRINEWEWTTPACQQRLRQASSQSVLDKPRSNHWHPLNYILARNTVKLLLFVIYRFSQG